MRERRRSLVGLVDSDKMDKTIIVVVERSYRHPLYGKVVRTRKRYVAHDEMNDCHQGDLVSIVESRPLSHTKRWVVKEIIKRAALPGG